MRHRGRRSKLVRIGVFLLPGAIINVAVAWGCALFAHRLSEQPAFYEASGELDLPYRNSTLRIDHGAAMQRYAIWIQWDSGGGSYPQLNVESALPAWAKGIHPIWDMSADDSVEQATGWPLLSLHGGVMEGKGRGAIVAPFQLEPGWPVLLPCKPMWPGFAIDTLFYAATSRLLFAAPFAWRRRRTKRGLCAACAYPIGASDVCTECGECGEPVGRRRAATVRERAASA